MREWLPAGLAAAALVALAPGAAPGDCQEDANPWVPRRVLNMAHAGGEHEAPTNTLYAHHLARANGANLLEFDVQRSADGVLVMIHDDTVIRVTDGSGRVDALTLEELRTLDKAYWFAPGGCNGCRNLPVEDYVFRGVATGDVPPPPGRCPITSRFSFRRASRASI